MSENGKSVQKTPTVHITVIYTYGQVKHLATEYISDS